MILPILFSSRSKNVIDDKLLFLNSVKPPLIERVLRESKLLFWNSMSWLPSKFKLVRLDNTLDEKLSNLGLLVRLRVFRKTKSLSEKSVRVLLTRFKYSNLLSLETAD